MQTESSICPLMANDAARMTARSALEKAGCSILGYESDGFIVMLKRIADPGAWKGQRSTLCEVMAAAHNFGGKVDERLYYWSLGSRQYPMEFRHWQDPYTPDNGFPDPGFYLTARIRFEPLKK